MYEYLIQVLRTYVEWRSLQIIKLTPWQTEQERQPHKRLKKACKFYHDKSNPNLEVQSKSGGVENGKGANTKKTGRQ